MEIINMAMTSHQAKTVIANAMPEQYFEILTLSERKPKALSRQEKMTLRNRRFSLKKMAKEDKVLRNRWNNAAKAAGYKNEAFHVSEE